jgi:hypothetical protein
MLRNLLLDRALRASVEVKDLSFTLPSGWLCAPGGSDGGENDRSDVLCIIRITPPRPATPATDGTAEHLSRPDDRSAKAGLNANANST